MHVQPDEQDGRFAPGGGALYLALDRFGREEYVTFHGVCFPFYVCVSYQTLGLGSPAHAGAQSPFPENRHLLSSHDEPYCLGIMSTFGTQGLRFWRWLFIILPSVLLFTILSAFILDSEFGLSIEPQSEPMSIVFGVSFLLALLFLLVVSPFFFRSLRAVAVIAWIIAVVILALSLLMPARAHL
jgi:hypothetical protein